MADEALARVGKGDPITADWANAVADAINARGASDPNANGTATPYGIMTPADVDTQMCAPDAQAMPFDAAIVREGADGDAIYMALPSGPDYVWLDGAAVAPDSGQTMGTAQNAFVRIESVRNGTPRYVLLAFTPKDSSTTPPTPPMWRVEVAATVARPSWADPNAPLVLLAGYNIAADDTSGTDSAPGDVPSLLKGLVQYHRGGISLGGSSWHADSEEEQFLSLDPPTTSEDTGLTLHQAHNFDTGADNQLLTLADGSGYGGTPVACRVTQSDGSVELMWRRIPTPTPTPGPPGPYPTGSFTTVDGMRLDATSGEIQYHEQPYTFVAGVAKKNGAGSWVKLMDTTDCS